MGDEEKDDMMDDDDSGSGEKPEAASFQSSKIVKILLYVAGGILLIVLMAGISFLVSKYVQEQSYKRDQDIVAAPPPPPLHTYELPGFANTTADEEPHFLKMKISLGYDMSIEMNNELVKRRDEIQHIINVLLQSKKYSELKSVKGAVNLQEEIKAHINQRLISGKIKEVYFKEYVIN